ncbi:hypothetical protein [cf. Phormidesmis sp. LEGE 11477]|uniref:hypothetical protein n=1 Tax=cf. Phormidesmis sp. LEGE 11477 TaxID=1828680 RepID=UPI00187E296F|nr:hypothetical protein [cf. Phormidesmis sp. LEGE 11477]MBE9062281.1 hypothetical protein [cf. Phormidesmis sp. LEGE 11477]
MTWLLIQKKFMCQYLALREVSFYDSILTISAQLSREVWEVKNDVIGLIGMYQTMLFYLIIEKIEKDLPLQGKDYGD